MEVPSLTIVIELESEKLVRRIPTALPLPAGLESGLAAERATEAAAALWGLPDFVHRADLRRVGGGSREVGDRLLILGDRGVVIQVKTRVGASQDEGKERRWVEKQVGRALAQARGTIRSLLRNPTWVTSARGDRVTLAPGGIHWLAAVIVDHPAPPDGLVPDLSSARHPVCVILRRDWEFLFAQLKSAHAVCEYLFRTAGQPLALGDEPARYFRLAVADRNAPPAPVNPALTGRSGRTFSTPLLPIDPAASDDPTAHLLLRSIFEDIATSRADPEARTRVLAELDRLPVTQRGVIGRAMIEAMQEARKVPPELTQTRFRRIVGALDGGGTLHLGFGVCSQPYDAQLAAVFRAWVELRHHETQQATGDARQLTSVGVLLTPGRDGQRPWDTSLAAISGDLRLTAEDVEARVGIWKHFDEAAA